eukprot:sb/3465778/
MILVLWILLIKQCSTSKICNWPSPIDNGVFDVADGNLVVKCGRGYELRGSSSVPCQSHKSLYTNLPSCVAIPCTLPPGTDHIVPDFVEGTSRKVKVGSTLQLSCPTEFVPSGHNVQCVTNTTFSALALPTCQAQNCVLKDRRVRFGQVTSLHLAPNSTVLVECDEGYQRDSKVEPVCISGTLFSDDFNKVCKRVPCPLPDIPHGTVHGGNGSHLEPGQVVQISCDGDYRVDNSYATCESDHVFKGTLPSCKPRPCPERPIPNGVISAGDPATILTIECNEGFTSKKGVPAITCQSYRSFTPVAAEPECLEKGCGVVSVVNGEVKAKGEVSHGERVSVTCGRDYQMMGESEVECANGKYNPPLPTCQGMLYFR